jgi:hypothetical protein
MSDTKFTRDDSNPSLHYSNEDKTVSNELRQWVAIPTNNLIDISDRYESGERELCWDLVLDKFVPEHNYFSIIFGTAYGDTPIQHIYKILGTGENTTCKEIGYFCGVRSIYNNDSYDINRVSKYEWASNPLKSGDIIQMKFKLISSTEFDVEFYVNGGMELVPVRVQGRYALPAVSLHYTQQVTLLN